MTAFALHHSQKATNESLFIAGRMLKSKKIINVCPINYHIDYVILLHGNNTNNNKH